MQEISDDLITSKLVEQLTTSIHDVSNASMLITENIILHSTVTPSPLKLTLQLENTCDEILHFTFNIIGSVNIYMVDTENPQITNLSMRPKTKSIPLEIIRIDEKSPYQLVLVTDWDNVELDEETEGEYNSSWNATISLLTSSQLLSTSAVHGKSREEILSILGVSEFMDGEFLPKHNTLYQVVAKKRSSMKTLAFRRLSSPEAHATIFGDGITPQDIALGSLPDVWLMCALSFLADTPDYVKSLFPIEFQTSSTTGLYKVLLYKNGVLTSFLLDDFFPCFISAGPVYSKAKSNALWVLLVEKAFAKMYGSYSVLHQGLPHQALLDLTGLPTRYLFFDDVDIQSQASDGTLFSLLETYMSNKCLLSVSSGTHTFDTIGLLPGHTFSILNLFKTKAGDCLVQLHNPWTLLNWEGDWSHNSSLWTDAIREEASINPNQSNAFWMSLSDMVSLLHCLNIVIPSVKIPKYIEKRENLELTYNMETKTGESSMFLFKAHQTGVVYFTIIQHDMHQKGEKPYIDIGVTILKKGENGELVFIASCGNSAERQNMVSANIEKDETYIVIPTSTGCKFLHFIGRDTVTVALEELSRSVVVVIQSETSFDLERTEYDPEVYITGIALPIFSGKTFYAVPDKVVIYSLKGGNAGISYAAKNISKKPIQLKIDFAHEGQEVITHKDSLLTCEKLMPGEMKILHHIFPVESSGILNTTWDYQLHADNNSNKPPPPAPTRAVVKSTSIHGRPESARSTMSANGQKADAACACAVM